MKTRTQTRGIKFVEAGLLLVAILTLTVYLGVRMNEPQTEAETVAVVDVVDQIDTPETDIAAASADTIDAFADTPDPVLVSDAVIYDETIQPAQIYRDGEEAWFARNYDEAADIFSVYTDRNPGNAWGHYMLGMSLWKADADEDAAGALQAALDIKPDHLKSLLNLARVQMELGDAPAALLLIDRAVATAPEQAEVWRMLGRVQHNLQNSDAAIQAYEDALRIDPDDSWSLNNLGLVLIEAGRSEEALAPLARAVSLNSTNACIHNNLGIALERCGYLNDAADVYQTTLDIDPDYTKALTSLARVQLQPVADTERRIDLAALATSFLVQPQSSGGEELAAADIIDQ
jgi:tetratricopeptide (TPR) repeat protein